MSPPYFKPSTDSPRLSHVQGGSAWSSSASFSDFEAPSGFAAIPPIN